ncbi:Uncharacterized protein KIAA1841 [Trichoplax sp. H2]|nr:Uncharacterized protein KIAA1841 [Trichoplax sp. H2]|eukprot:RDD47288.1 Uncharacterized protein KIAA1841 [Trichoplax sp. H2]
MKTLLSTSGSGYFSSLIAKKLRMPSAAAFQGYETMMNRKSKFIDQLASELMLGRLLMLTEEHNIDHASSLPVIEISSALEAPRDSQFLAEWRQMNRTSLQYKNAKETALRCKLNDKEKFQSSSCIGFESNQIARRNSAKEIETRVYRHPIVIHVYDDANQITKDFICPRELLVKEMQYFAECLPHDISSPDDIDISVHCDIKIFRWLMEYVKSNDKDANGDQSKITEKPKLEFFAVVLTLTFIARKNVIPIIISADYLKMNKLVDECLLYFRCNISEILASSNPKCLNDGLLKKLVKLLTVDEIAMIKDTKDKITTKLYQKKLEELFYSENAGQGNGTTLFRCSNCDRIITMEMQPFIKCSVETTHIARNGDLVYLHNRDRQWNINVFIKEQYSELKCWKKLYWRFWSQINYLRCINCNELFPCSDLSCCNAKGNDNNSGKIAVSKKMAVFDPCKIVQSNTRQEHVYSPTNTDNNNLFMAKIWQTLINHKDDICCMNTTSTKSRQLKSNPFAAEDLFNQGLKRSKNEHTSNTNRTERKPNTLQNVNLQAKKTVLINTDDFSISSCEEDDSENDTPISRKILKETSISLSKQELTKHGVSAQHLNLWDNDRNDRWNEDMQREEDQDRLRNIIHCLSSSYHSESEDVKLDNKEASSQTGLYYMIEKKFKAEIENIALTSLPMVQNSTANNSINNNLRPSSRLRQKSSIGK